MGNRGEQQRQGQGGNSMGNRGGDSVVGNNRTGDGVGNRRGNNVREDGLSVVGDLGDISLGVVGPVVDVLDAAVRKVDGVVALPRGRAVVGLASVKAGAGVVVGHGVLVLVGRDLVRVDLGDSVGDRVSNGVTNKAVTNAVANNTMANNTMANNTMANNHTVGNSNAVSHRASHG